MVGCTFNTGGRSKQDQTLLARTGKYIGVGVYRRSYLLCMVPRNGGMKGGALVACAIYSMSAPHYPSVLFSCDGTHILVAAGVSKRRLHG